MAKNLKVSTEQGALIVKCWYVSRNMIQSLYYSIQVNLRKKLL